MSEYSDDDSRDVRTKIRQEDGKITMESSSVMTLRVDSPRRQPLGEIETHATLSVRTHGASVEIDLDAAAVDALLDDLRKVQTGEAFDVSAE